jgi:amino acid transporter
MTNDSPALGAKIPATEQAPQRLRQGVLSVFDIAAATMANIGAAMSFYFGFGFLAYTAGLASPLTIVAAIICIAFLGNTLSEFTKILPSTGGFISYIGKSFGPQAGVTTALLAGAGYATAMSSVTAIVGGFFQILLQYYNVAGLKDVPWIIWTVLFLAAAVFMMIRGVKISTKIAGAFFVFEIVVMIVVSIIALFKFHANINFKPFEPSHITNGFKGLAAGFPLAVYLFIGWENSAALAEETDNPRKNVPKAVFASVAIMGVSYLLFAFSTVISFKGNVSALSSAAIPFLTMAHGAVGGLVIFGYIAGMTSTLACLIAGTNSQARLIFNAGREGLLPRSIGKVHEKHRTPVNALIVFLSIGLAIIGIWGLLHIIGGHATSGSMSPLNFFFESSTFGTILVLLIYLLANLGLPIFYRKYAADKFNVFRHGVLPIIGALTILVPLYYLTKPGQATPYNWYPYAALGVLVIAGIYSVVLVRRDPGIGDRVGSIVADE